MIARQMEAWWQEHGGQHNDPEWIAYQQTLRDLMGRKIDETLAEHDNKGRFGMSNAGGCTRAAALKLLGYESTPRSGSTKATFWIGHMLEVMALATLSRLYPVTASTEDGTQIPATIEPFMHSYSDGVITLDNTTQAIVGVKSMGYKMSGSRYVKGEGKVWTRKGFSELPAFGVKKAQPKHWAQAQAEMHGTGLRSFLYVAVAKDMVMAMAGDPKMQESGSLTFYAELIPYDDKFCHGTLERVWSNTWNQVRDGETVTPLLLTTRGDWPVYFQLNPSDAAANKAASGTFDMCSYCDLRDACTVAYPLAQSIRRAS
jgi:hypothetical protein